MSAPREEQKKPEGIVTGPRPLVVCPVCGPRTLMFAGRIVHKVCKQCKELTDD